MSKGPGLFTDIGKKARDLLTKDYSYDKKFTVSTNSNVGVALTSAVIKKGGLSTGDVTAAYKYHQTNIAVKVDTESKILTTLTFLDVLPSTKFIASLRLPDYTSGKVEVQYFHDIAAATAATTLNSQSPVVDLSLTLGTPTFSVGGEAAFDSTASSFTKYNAGISIKMPDSSTDIVLVDKADMLKVSHVHDLGEKKKNAIVAEFTRRFSTNENTITVGGSHALESFTVVKGRLNNHGKLGTLLQHEVKPNSILTISGEFDTLALDKKPKFGLALALKS